MSKKLTAADVIAQAEARERVASPSKDALKQLAKIIEHNDAQTATGKRVHFSRAIEVLQAYGWEGRSLATLNKVCKEALGRQGYAKP